MELNNSPVLVTGASGMLGHDVVSVLLRRHAILELLSLEPTTVHGFPVLTLDITDQSAVRAAVKNFRPRVIINCAAYTAVDKAEENREIAFAVNAQGPRLLAQAAREVGAFLVHISTDYVFGARDGNTPWRENDACSPCGVYGESKREGEIGVLDALPTASLIIRTSWLHGVYGPNFVHTILRMAKERSELRVVSDQIGSPTWSAWLAEVIVRLLERDVSGIVHASSRGNISWFDFASEIVRLAGLSTKVLPQTTAEAGRRAPRPPYSTLGTNLLEHLLQDSVPSWKDGLLEHLSLIAAGGGVK